MMSQPETGRMILTCFVPSSATCEMCGMVGVRDAFYSKTKRFCSVSCSRSYSSNSKKASILARLQVQNTLSDEQANSRPSTSLSVMSVDLCALLKGKPPTKKSKVLQKQPLMNQLAAYTQHHGNQQSGVKRSGEHAPTSAVSVSF